MTRRVPLSKVLSIAWRGLRFNQNMLGVFLNWKGAALFLLLFFGAALLIFYEYAVIINIVALYRQHPGRFSAFPRTRTPG